MRSVCALVRSCRAGAVVAPFRAHTVAQEVLGLPGLPQEVQPEMLQSDTFLKALHHVLLEVHVEEGALICPESGHRFAITSGIPNMLLDEDKVTVAPRA